MNTQIATRRAFGFFACAAITMLSVSAFAQNTRYANANGFSLQVPAGFTRNTKQAPAGAALFMAPAQNNFSANIMIQGGAVDQHSFEELVRGANKDLKGDKTATVLSQQDVLKGAGTPIHVFKVRRPVTNGVTVDQYQLVGMKGKRGYIITMSALTSNIKQYAPAFEKTIASLHWDK